MKRNNGGWSRFVLPMVELGYPVSRYGLAQEREKSGEPAGLGAVGVKQGDGHGGDVPFVEAAYQ